MSRYEAFRGVEGPIQVVVVGLATASTLIGATPAEYAIVVCLGLLVFNTHDL